MSAVYYKGIIVVNFGVLFGTKELSKVQKVICLQQFIAVGYLAIILRARMGSESIAHKAEGRMGY